MIHVESDTYGVLQYLKTWTRRIVAFLVIESMVSRDEIKERETGMVVNSKGMQIGRWWLVKHNAEHFTCTVYDRSCDTSRNYELKDGAFTEV